jgi:alpha-amylase
MTAVLVARGDGSAEALRSLVPERIPDPSVLISTVKQQVIARDLACGQKNAVLRRGHLARRLVSALVLLVVVGPLQGQIRVTEPSTFWNSATVYFLLIDRFHNGNPVNDRAMGRAKDGARLRNFEGGDLAGVLQKIEVGYFDSLGVTAIWMTPFVEQIHGSVDEGTGKTYGYHGYWTRDWTAVDPALGNEEDLRAVVDAAHRRGIRVLMDAVINHTGPVTRQDPAWPSDWVRTGPNCTYKSYTTTVDCTLVATLPDIRTDSDAPVALPLSLLEKWEREGRRDQEVAELDAFFRRTGYPRAPRYYVIKWLTDWVRELGFDGYRLDTAKHFEPAAGVELKREAGIALGEWRRKHPDQVRDSLPFYIVGEVYGWEPSQGRSYNFGDRTLDFFANGYDALINFGFKTDTASLDALFTGYSSTINEGALGGVSLLNYLSSHDDGSPYDRDRKDPLGAGTRLLLAPGGAQIYYGDELARPLVVPGAEGDANLRSLMNWGDQKRRGEVLEHWRRLGRFRRDHPAVGGGIHRTLQARPYIFSRVLGVGGSIDRVVVAMDQGKGAKIPVFGVFPGGTVLVDAYSGAAGTVRDDAVSLTTSSGLVLLAERQPAAR